MITTTYCMDDMEVAVPDGYVDKTVHALEWPTEDGGRVSLVVQRDQSQARGKIDDLFAKLMDEYSKRLPMFQADEPPAVELQVPFRIAALRWKKEQQLIYQVQLFVELEDRNLVATFSAAPTYREHIDEWVGEFCRSLRIRSSS
jgi:hypothetical protein